MSNHKWGEVPREEGLLRVCFMVSRNKDNSNLTNFKKRKKAFITKADNNELHKQFLDFVKAGVPGELSRLYVSVNARDEDKVRIQLIHFLIDNPEYNLASLPAKLAGIAATKECALEKKWLFDFDSTDPELLSTFIDDIYACDAKVELKSFPTPHGFAIITNRGFDARMYDGQLLLEKYKDVVSLKRDDLRCISWEQNI